MPSSRPSRPGRSPAGWLGRLIASAVCLTLLLGPIPPVRAAQGAPLAAAPPATSPVLLVTSAGSANPFGSYLGEILRAEGFNTYQSADLADLTDAYLASFGLVVLAETPLTGPQATMFSTYVSNGGQLVAMRPDAQ